MILTSSEIKAQLLNQEQTPLPSGHSTKERSDAIELGNAVKRMTGTTGWKIVESWILRQLDVGKILQATPEKLPFVHAKAQGYADVIRQVNYWITLAEQLENMENKKE